MKEGEREGGRERRRRREGSEGERGGRERERKHKMSTHFLKTNF